MTRSVPCLTWLTLLLWIPIASAQEPRDNVSLVSVEGTVLDQRGDPVEGATVYAESESRPLHGRRATSTTDNQGHYLLANVWPDQKPVTIYAYKSTEFYGDPTICCYRSQSALFPQLILKPGESVHNVVVRLGEKAAVIKIKILDATTHEPLQSLLVFVCTSSNPNDCMGRSVSSQDEVFVPPGSVSLSVQAPRYTEWKYSDSSAGTSSPHFSSGEIRSILVEMEMAELATVRGIVLDENGKTVENASVFAELDRPLAGREFPLTSETVTTNHEGRFVLVLDSGPVTIWAFDQFHPNEFNGGVVGLVPLCASPCGTPSVFRISGTYPYLNLKAGDDLSGVIVHLGRRRP
jgi:hypothetical protein